MRSDEPCSPSALPDIFWQSSRLARFRGFHTLNADVGVVDSHWAHPNHEEVDQVLFSQDSSMFASLSRRDTKFWDTVTGAPIGTIVDKVSAIADDFSTAASYTDSTITLYDVNSCTSLATLNVAPGSVVKLAVSPDGSRLAAGLSDSTVCLWHWRSIGLETQRLDNFAWNKALGNCCLAFNSSGDRLVFGTKAGIVLRNGVSGEFIAHMNPPGKSKQYPECIAFSRNGSRLAYRDQSQLSLWDGKSGALIAMTELKDPGNAIAISGDGLLIAIDEGIFVTLWNLNSRNRLEFSPYSLLWPRSTNLSMALHHDGLFVIIRTLPGVFRNAIIYDINAGIRLSWKNSIRSWHRDLKSRNPFRLARQRRSFAFIMGISPDSTRIIMGSGASSLQLVVFENAILRPPKLRNLFEAVRFLTVSAFNRHMSIPQRLATPVTRLNFSPDCLRLASCHDDGSLGLWDTSCSRQLVSALKSEGKRVRSCVFSTDGSHFVSASFHSTIKLWDSRNGARIGTLKPKYPKVTSMVFLRGMLAVRSQTDDDSPKSDITLWDVKKLRRIVTVTNNSSELSELFHHDIMLIYYTTSSQSSNVDVTVWDAENRTPYATISMGSFFDSIEVMVMSPDKSKLVIQLDDGNLKIFDLPDGCEEIVLNIRREDLGWDWLPPIRSWHRLPVWLHRTENGSYCVSARSSQDGALIPVLWIQGVADLGMHHVARGSSMFALRYDYNHIVVLRQSSTGSFD